MKRNSALFFILTGILLIAAAGIVVLKPENNVSATGEITTAPEVGAYAPDFSLPSLNDETIHLSDYQGKVVLINFWAVWCPPCRQEMPSIQQAYEQYGPDLVVLSVNAGDARADAIDFKEEYGLTFEIVLDADHAVQDLFRVRGLPTTLIIDQQGIIQVVHIGFLDHSQLNGYLDQVGIK
ncbi:MAG: TlpA disulfide reductase family protein [Chloroflexota bacterium]